MIATTGLFVVIFPRTPAKGVVELEFFGFHFCLSTSFQQREGVLKWKLFINIDFKITFA
jgi:hypothetical protein